MTEEDPYERMRSMLAALQAESALLDAEMAAQLAAQLAAGRALQGRLEELTAGIPPVGTAPHVVPSPEGEAASPVGVPASEVASPTAAPAAEGSATPTEVERLDGGVSRRHLLQLGALAAGAGAIVTAMHHGAGAGVAAGGGPAGATDLLLTAVRSENAAATATNGMVYVAPPTGVASTDTANALAALNTPAGTTVVFLADLTNVYVINQELPVPAGVRVVGTGAPNEQYTTGLISTLRQAPGTSLRCVLGSAAFLAGLYGPANPGLYPQAVSQYGNGTPSTASDAAIEVDHLAFDGNNGHKGTGNTAGHAVVLMSSGSKVHDCYFLDSAQAAVVVSDANFAGMPVTAGAGLTDNRVYDNKVFNSGEYGIWVTETPGSTGATDGYVLNNVIQAPSAEIQTPPRSSGGHYFEALRLDNAAGWWVANNHAYSCAGSGMFFNNAWNLHLANNSTDDFGANPVAGGVYVGYDIQTVGTQPTPCLVNGNQVSAYEGFNSNANTGTVAADNTNSYLYYRVTVQPAAPGDQVWLEQANNTAHQDSQPPASIAGCTVSGTGVTVPSGTALSNVIQVGMSVSDSAGVIPAGTTVAAVNASGHVITLSRPAGSATNDTVSFPPPGSIGWTYVNQTAGATLVVHRTNETVTPTINATPSIVGPGTVTIVDPATMAGGVPVQGQPLASQTIVATSATTAAWMDPLGGPPSGVAGGVLGGSYPNPGLAATAVTVVTGASTTYKVPGGATKLRVICVGGGGGGGGGGSASSSIAQVGGSGGAAGATSQQIVSVTPDQKLTVAPGAGGGGGAGGAPGQNSGANGGAGTASTVSGTNVAVVGGGGGGGRGGPAGSTSPVGGAAYGAVAGVFTANAGAGCGGSSGLAGGLPTTFSPGGGGGGGTATNKLGGTAGGPGGAHAAGGAGAAGAASSAAGGAGAPASDPGAAGGGGGAGTNGTGAGGNGGAGAAGYVVIEVVG